MGLRHPVQQTLISGSFAKRATTYFAKEPLSIYTTYAKPQELHGVAAISRRLKMIGLFCKRALQKRRYSAKETYNLKEPINRSHPIGIQRPITRWYGVATISRLLKMIGLFCKRAL